MRICKQMYKSKKGEIKYSKNWYVRIYDQRKIAQSFPAFTDKQQSIKFGQKIEKLVICKLNNESPDRELSEWLNQLSSTVLDKFAKIGLIDSKRAASGKILSEHLEDFRNSLLAKGTSNKQVSQSISRITKIFEKCNFNNWNEINTDVIQQEISQIHKFTERVEIKIVRDKKVKIKKLIDKGPISTKTANYYLKTIKQFCNWMVINRRASESPVQFLQSINNLSESRKRRALEPDELRLLLKTAQGGPKRFGLSGTARAMLYQLAVETGLRANELRSLKKSSFDFNNLTVIVDAGYTKNKKQAVLPLKKDTAKKLKEFFSGIALDAPAFKVPEKTADMIKEDLEDSGIPYVDNEGKYADFHALRHTTGSWLAASGVHPKIAQVIMRHSDINLTMSRYTHIFRGQESEAIAKLPDLSNSEPKIGPKSDGQQIEQKKGLPSGLPSNDGQIRTTANMGEQKNRVLVTKNAVSYRGRRGSNPQPSDRQSARANS